MSKPQQPQRLNRAILYVLFYANSMKVIADADHRKVREAGGNSTGTCPPSAILPPQDHYFLVKPVKLQVQKFLRCLGRSKIVHKSVIVIL